MPFVKVNPIEEARELQEHFKESPEAVKQFQEYEKKHIEAEKIKEEELNLRKKLVELRVAKNISQKELEEKTGLSQQAISRLEIDTTISPNLKTLIKYMEGINCKLVLQEK